MAEYEEKFIVINTKHIEQLNSSYAESERTAPCEIVLRLDKALTEFYKKCKSRIKKDLSENNYYVCNQDEPYAQQVIDIILKGEDTLREEK